MNRRVGEECAVEELIRRIGCDLLDEGDVQIWGGTSQKWRLNSMY